MNEHNELQVDSEVDWESENDNANGEAIIANSSFLDDFTEKQELSSGQENKIGEQTSVLSLALDESHLNVQNIEQNQNDVKEIDKKQTISRSEIVEKIKIYLNQIEDDNAKLEFLKYLNAKLGLPFPELDNITTANQLKSVSNSNQQIEEHTNTQPVLKKSEENTASVPDTTTGAIVDNISRVVDSITRIGADGVSLLANVFDGVVSKRLKKDLTDREYLDKNKNQVVSGINNISFTATDSNIPSNILYRLEVLKQNEKLYRDNLQTLWQESELSKVKKRVQDFACEQNLSFQDVVQKINQDPGLYEISDEFNKAVSASPEAQKKIDSMDHALSSWMKAHTALTNDFCYLDPENEEMQKVFKEYEQSSDNMKEATQEMPKQEGKDQSHFLKLMEYMEKIKEKIKEFVTSVKNFFSKTFGQNEQKNESNIPSI